MEKFYLIYKNRLLEIFLYKNLTVFTGTFDNLDFPV